MCVQASMDHTPSFTQHFFPPQMVTYSTLVGTLLKKLKSVSGPEGSPVFPYWEGPWLPWLLCSPALSPALLLMSVCVAFYLEKRSLEVGLVGQNQC